MGASGLLSSTSLDPHSNPPERHPDTTKRLTRVYVLGTWGSCLGRLCRVCPVQAHWAAAFVFQEGFVLVAELTAINGRGQAWQENQYSINFAPDLDSFEIEKGYRKLWHQEITIVTSPDELHRKCFDNPMNKERYGLLFNNCQKWIAVLLRDQYGKDYGIAESMLPGRCGWGCYVFFGCLLIFVVTFLLGLFFENLSLFVLDTCCSSIFDSPVSGEIVTLGLSFASVAFFFCICFCAYKRCNPSAAARRTGQ